MANNEGSLLSSQYAQVGTTPATTNVRRNKHLKIEKCPQDSSHNNNTVTQNTPLEQYQEASLWLEAQIKRTNDEHEDEEPLAEAS